MKTRQLLMPMALVTAMLFSLNSNATKGRFSQTTSGIPFTLKYLMAHHMPVQNDSFKSFYSPGRVYMYMGATQAGLYTDWTIIVSNSNYSYTWRTTDGSQGSINNYQSNYYEFTSYTGIEAIPPGTYTVSVQCNQSGAWRDDIGVTGDNDTGRWVQDYNAYDQPYVVENVEITANGEGIWIGTTTNY
jgi:hypothetical protein